MKPDNGYIAYIINPKSGASSDKRLVSGFRQYLTAQGFELRQVITESLEHANAATAAAAADPACQLICAAGGDGTLREALTALVGSDKPFMPIPCGTENLLANELGFDHTVQTLIKAFVSSQTRKLDLGKINDRIFTSIAGYGFDGAVIHRMHRRRTGHIHHLDYFWPIWRTFWEYNFPPMRVTADGKEVFCGRGLVFVGNISRYAIGLSILKNADYSDGKLDICIFRCRQQAHLLWHSLKTIFKRHTNSRSAMYLQAQRIDIESPDGATIYGQIDGDPAPPLPAHIQIIPKAVMVLVPPGAKPAGIRTRLRRMIG